jgi:Galactose oxidase, central domain
VELGGGGVRPSARDFAKLAALPGGRLLLFGGLDAAEKRLDDAWLFDAATCAVPRTLVDYKVSLAAAVTAVVASCIRDALVT